MNIVLDTYLFDALQAQREGVEFPIEFEVVWEAFGFKHSYHARRFFRGIYETLVSKGLSPSGCLHDDSSKINKYWLSVKGFKFALARAETDRGAEYLLHLLDIEEQFLAKLEAQYAAPSHTAPAFTYPAAQLQAIAGYASLSYTKTAIRRDFVCGLHYLERGREMVLTETCFALAVNGSRSRAGVDLENCPDIQISIKDAIAHHAAKAANKQNARLGRSGVCDGQLSLW